MPIIKYKRVFGCFELVEISIAEQDICLKAYEDFKPQLPWITFGGLISEVEDIMKLCGIKLCTDFTVTRVFG